MLAQRDSTPIVSQPPSHADCERSASRLLTNSEAGVDSGARGFVIINRTVPLVYQRVVLWSQRLLSEMANADQSTITSFEDGDRLLWAAKLNKMTEALEARFPG